jgi:hypothetical protein
VADLEPDVVLLNVKFAASPEEVHIPVSLGGSPLYEKPPAPYFPDGSEFLLKGVPLGPLRLAVVREMNGLIYPVVEYPAGNFQKKMIPQYGPGYFLKDVAPGYMTCNAIPAP